MSSVSMIKTNTERLGKTAAKVDGYIQNIKKELEKMGQSVQELDQMWDGPSSEAFKKAFADDVVLAVEMINGLIDVNNFEKTAKKEYENCEKQIEDLISNLKF